MCVFSTISTSWATCVSLFYEPARSSTQFPQAFIQFPGLKSAAENQEYVITCVLDALNTLSLLADGEDPSNNTFGIGKPAPGEIVVAFKEFEVKSKFMLTDVM